MQIDLSTLWYLTTGTLVVGAAMTFRERQLHPHRSKELAIWSLAYLVFASGCVVVMNRERFPGISGWATVNVVMVLGYLMVLHGVARLDDRRPILWPCVLLACVALTWGFAGAPMRSAFWNHVSALPIALTCSLTAWSLLRSNTVRALRSRSIAATIFVLHAVFYLIRAFLMPVLVMIYGSDLLPIMAKITMYEAVLYSMAMPMGLLALVREEAQAKLLATSQTDYLTGLCNRHGFFAQGEALLARKLPEQSVSLLAFDLDHFKAINDRYGHATGDKVLKLFAATAASHVDDDAILVRLGGEEFAILLPGRDGPTALQIGRRISEAFRLAAARPDGLAITATVSAGLAGADNGRNTLDTLLLSADHALYRAKSKGRNRIEVADTIALVRAA